MKKLRYLILFFSLSTVGLLCAMCSMISYTFCELKYAALYEGASAPASMALLYLIPFIPAAVITAVCAFVFHKKHVERKKSK